MVVDATEFDASKLGRKIGVEELRRIQLDMLDALADFCDAHGITYYLSAGSLLGAVRHGGYIPWDDDIDVNMPRPDYEKLKQLSGCRLNDHLEIASPEGPIEHSTSFPRVCDTRYVLRSNSRDGKSVYYTNMFIDIFPIEGLPTNLKRVRLHYYHTKALITMRKLAYFKGPLSGQPGFFKTARTIVRPLAKLMGYRFWNRRLLKAAMKYRYEDCEYVGVVTGYVHTMEEYIKKEGYGTPTTVTFEGKPYKAPADWDKYLSNLYGDYMKLPPESERRMHHFDVWEYAGGNQ
ncbi:MAG: LicD family protein [Clostridia bacterium]|nr:LicD family protein [Clostridia bacterium]